MVSERTVSSSVKELFVGTFIGGLALNARNAIELFRSAYSNPEKLGTLANDQLAALLVAKLCLPGKGFLDVGAHIGSIIAAVISHDSSIRVYAVEPMAAKVSHLRRRFPAVELYECAAGESDGTVAFFVNTQQSGYSSLVRPINAEATFAIKIPMKKLDNLISSDAIDMVKIDVEGAELGVMRGADVLIMRNRPVLMFESGPHAGDPPLGYTKESMWEWLDERDFDIVIPNRVAHEGPGLNMNGFVEAHFHPRRTTNYFAIPRERRLEIRDRARRVLRISNHSV